MLLGGLVIGEVDHVVAGATQDVRDGGAFLDTTLELYTDEDAGPVVGVLATAALVDAVVELGDHPAVEHLAEAQERALLLGDGDGEDALATLTELGALGDVAQRVEVEIRAREDVDQGLVVDVVGGHVLLQAGQGGRTGGLGDGTVVVEEVLDRRADLVGADGDDLVEVVAAQPEGLGADGLHGHALGEEADVVEGNRLPRLQGRGEAGGLLRLHTDDLDLRVELLEQDGHTGSEATATDRDEDPVDRAGLEDLQTDGALAGDDGLIVERRHILQALELGEFLGLGLGGVEVLAVQDDLAAETAHGVDLDRRGGHRHDDDRAQAEFAAGEGHTLSMVAGGRGDHTGTTDELGHAVEGSTQLETVHRLQVFTLDQHPVVNSLRQSVHRFDGGVLRGPVDRRGDDVAEVFSRSLCHG